MAAFSCRSSSRFGVVLYHLPHASVARSHSFNFGRYMQRCPNFRNNVNDCQTKSACVSAHCPCRSCVWRRDSEHHRPAGRNTSHRRGHERTTDAPAGGHRECPPVDVPGIGWRTRRASSWIDLQVSGTSAGLRWSPRYNTARSRGGSKHKNKKKTKKTTQQPKNREQTKTNHKKPQPLEMRV